MEINGKKIFNFRPLCMIAFGMIVGIVAGESIAGKNYAFLAIPFCFAAAVCVVLAIFKKCRKYLIIPIAFAVGLTGITISDYVYITRLLPDGYTGPMTMTVDSEIVSESGSIKFYVSDIYANGKRLKLGGYLKYEVDSDFELNFDAGDILYVYGMIPPEQYTSFESLDASSRSKNRAHGIVPFYLKKQSENKPKASLAIRMRIINGFDSVLDKETAALCKALTLGDRFGMRDSLVENINVSGLAHAFAVSGLHITAIATALYFLLKKLKVKPAIAFAAVEIITFLYVWLCYFTASALRAFIMSSVLNFADIFGGKKSDGVSTLSLAAILILLFRPFALYDMGFLMSFSSLLGIILFEKPLSAIGIRAATKLIFGSEAKAVSIGGGALVSFGGKEYWGVNGLYSLDKFRRPAQYSESSYKARAVALSAFTKLSHAVALALSASAMSSIFVAYAFGRVPLLFVLSSVVMLPYLVAVYVVMLVLTLLSCIFGVSAILTPLHALLLPFRVYVRLAGEISFTSVPVSIVWAQIAFVILLFLLLSGKVFITRQTKAKCIPVLISLIAVTSFVALL